MALSREQLFEIKVKSNISKLFKNMNKAFTCYQNQKEDATTKALQTLAETCQELIQVYPEAHLPQEIKELISWSRNYSNQKTLPALNEIAKALQLGGEQKIQNLLLAPEKSDTETLNFQNTYQQEYNKSKIPEIFESILTQIQNIIKSGEIDSLKYLEALKKLAATLERNIKRKSYAESWSLADYIYRFFHKSVSMYSEKWINDNEGTTANAMRSICSSLKELNEEHPKFLNNATKSIEANINSVLPNHPSMEGLYPEFDPQYAPTKLIQITQHSERLIHEKS